MWLCESLQKTLELLKMPKGVCSGRPKGKSVARRRLPMEKATESAIPMRPGDPIPRIPLLSESPRSPPPKDPSSPPSWKGDSFSTALNELSGWKGSQMTPRKRSRLYYAAIYCDDLPKSEPQEIRQ